MNPCACCGLSGRGGTMVVAIISLLHCLVTGITMVVDQFSVPVHNKRHMSTTQFILMQIHGALFFIVSAMLFAGAYYKNLYLCLPWIVSSVIGILLYIIVIATMAVTMFSHPVVYLMVAFFLALLMLIIPVYFLWIVIRFVGKLKKEHDAYIQLMDNDDVEADMNLSTKKRHKKSKRENYLDFDTFDKGEIR